MYKKTLIQILLIFIIFLVIFSFFKFYFFNKKEIVELDTNKISQQKNIIEENKSNFIKNLKYISSDELGNKYEIKAEKGDINLEDADIINMENVIAIIDMLNSSPIIIKSNYATYNNVNYDTYFKGSVIIDYETHNISSQKLDLVFKNNKAYIYEDVIYKNINTNLNADRIEIDLITKNSKIFMNNDYKKVQLSVNK